MYEYRRPEFYTDPELSSDLMETTGKCIDLGDEAFRREPYIIFRINHTWKNQEIKILAELHRTNEEILSAEQEDAVAPITGAKLTTKIANMHAMTTLTTGVGQLPGSPPRSSDVITNFDLQNVITDMYLRLGEIATVTATSDRKVALNKPSDTEKMAKGILNVLRDITSPTAL